VWRREAVLTADALPACAYGIAPARGLRLFVDTWGAPEFGFVNVSGKVYMEKKPEQVFCLRERVHVCKAMQSMKRCLSRWAGLRTFSRRVQRWRTQNSGL